MSASSWLQRISTVQSQRLSPEERSALLERAERQRRHELSRRKTRAMYSHSKRSSALCTESLRQMSTAAVEDMEAARTRWSLATRTSAARQERAWHALSAPSALAVALRDDSDDEAEALEEAADLVGGDARRLAEDAADEGTAAVAAVLEQLRAEPADAAECAAKFQLYEEYASQLERMRGSVFQLFEESRGSLPRAVEADMERQLKGIDRQDTMGIPEETSEWFVFHMMKASEANNRRLAAILSGFERQLEFLAKNDQAECPVCFEAFDASRASETLGCCHRICKECWANWSAVMRGNAFCPLCRNSEFLNVVIRQGTQPGMA